MYVQSIRRMAIMARTYKLSAHIEVKPDHKARDAELYPRHRQKVGFEGSLEQAKSGSTLWRWSIRERGGKLVDSGEILSLDAPTESALVKMRTAAKEAWFARTNPYNLKYSGWGLK
jgi:hypothetical protein